MAGEVMLNAFCPDLQDFCVLTLDLPLKSRAIQKELKDAWGDRSFTIHSVPTQVHLPETPDPLEIWRALLPHNPHIFLQVTPTVLKALGNVDDLNQERVHLIIRTTSINAFDMGAGKTILMEGSPKERLCNILPQTLKDYQLYKVSDGMKLEPDVQLRVRLSALDLSQFQPLNTVLPVQDLSPWGFVPGYLHLLLMRF
ncbi:hypothetical protein OE88DRAFT_401434 [Heliocybe sulcata]|uniref:Uncharacterized protein n=1 Tax=Heliocybe sulcata TaxID=5364 RepID=A0A5C3N679_9AGAM|nr:hypothetical protein OE88DRAFT_401434 [Heliocybe sulcata]